MATCYDCIHTYPCKYDRFFGVDEVENKCHYFKNKAEVVEVKHGKWVPAEGGLFYACSSCGYLVEYQLTNFCPNCGAKMLMNT